LHITCSTLLGTTICDFQEQIGSLFPLISAATGSFSKC
jgi:hypothetical protein